MAGRRIVITGATRGLGKALTEGFAKLGHVVIGCGRSAELTAELNARLGSPHAFSVVDVGDDDAVKTWAERFLADGGPPDLLINNAAVMNRPAPLWEIGAEEFDRLTRVNINGIANVIRHVVPAMIERGSGVIANLSSGWGRSTSPEVAPYCATKWAVEGLSKALAQELPRGLACVPVNPGIIDTDMLREAWSDGAAGFPKAAVWAREAVPFFLSLGPKHNGKSVSVTGAE